MSPEYGWVRPLCTRLSSVFLTNSLGTRWLSRWDKEIDLLVKVLYYGLTVGRGQCTYVIEILLKLDRHVQQHRHLAKNIPGFGNILLRQNEYRRHEYVPP